MTNTLEMLHVRLLNKGKHPLPYNVSRPLLYNGGAAVWKLEAAKRTAL